ncbi:MAG: RagB/SusD family nutrient uptake outer membrane protein [Parabacteroides sp.]|nr:RagB/SusD family nutrient uptake outer membrane protein [Parabacteroides sp.]
MNTKFKYILMTAAVGSMMGFGSCSSDFMDLTPTTEYTQEQVFSDPASTQLLINNIYDYAVDGAREHTTTGLTDDAYFTHNYGQIAVNQATVSESDLQWYNDGNCPFQWTNAYKGIYYANLVLNNIDNVPAKGDYNLAAMKGETEFLRAYLYTDLVRGFGGVPIVTKAFTLKDQDQMQIGRSDIATCLDFIIKDCEDAFATLPSTALAGRATKWAAKALEARIYLQIASPLYADRTVNTLAVNQYNGDRKVLYQKALDAAKAVIASGNFSLFDCRGATVEAVAEKYHDIAITHNSETIWAKQFDLTRVTQNVGQQHGPNGYHNWSGTTPTEDFVMSFEMADGSLSSGLTKVGEHVDSNPYLGREPRFYADLGFDGSVWGRKRAADGYALDPTPKGNLQTGTYELSSGGKEVEVILPDGTKTTFNGTYGCDTRKGPIEDWNGSFTGYYEKKLINTTIDAANNYQVCPYPYFRLSDMYLIAAEASVELGQLDDAATYLDALRARISMPDTKTTLAKRGQSFTQADMREFVRHERRSELAYEDSRYYDVRRWMIAPTTNNKELTGILILARLKPGKTAAAPYVHNENTWDYHYYVQSLSYREARKWDNKMYFAPIKRDEINRNTKLVQNPGMK